MTSPDLLALAARHARPVLVAGLLAGMALPDLASYLSNWIPEMVVLLLFLGALRLSPRDVKDMGRNLPQSIGFVLLGQLVLALALAVLGHAVGAINSPVLLGLVLLASAPPIVSSPNIAAIMGLSAPTAMRLMVLGSVLVPITSLPVFWLMPTLGSLDQVMLATLKLTMTIFMAGGCAIGVRQLVLPSPSSTTLARIDGLSVLALAVFVIALMASVAQAILTTPMLFLFWLIIAFVANFGLQLVVLRFGRAPVDGAHALVAGNRNISLFFVALPPEVTAPLLIFLGCYQLPMLLTPVVMQKAYRTFTR